MLGALLAGAVGTATAPAASAQTAPPDRDALRSRLLQAAGGAGRLAEQPATGRLRFFGTSPDRPVARAQNVPAGASPESAARGFLATYGTLFGADNPGRDLAAMRTAAADRGRSSVRFQQLHQGVPVFGGELIVNLDAGRNVQSTIGELTPQPTVDVKPVLVAAEAAVQAVGAMAKAHETEPGLLRAAAPALWVYDPALLGAPDRPGARLVWRTEVTSSGEDTMRELVLVDARNGGIALHFDQDEGAETRRICDRNNLVKADETCSAPYARTEGGPATGVADVDNAYTYSGNVYDFYLSNFGRDSLNGLGMPLISTVRYCKTSCPYANAFWNGSQMTFGTGWVADDVVGHEFTHGVTESESNLFSYYQSGAINESISDVFGELIDQGNGLGNDGPDVRWLIGEDLARGALRNMANPPAFGQPDSMTSPNYATGSADSGGVHANNGVNNKAAFLMTDGGTFNGITVTGLGAAKVAQIYYEVNANLLTSAADYLDLFHALKQACLNKVGVAGITVTDCGEVDKAVTATKMDQPAPGSPAEAPVCAPGASPHDLFFDNMENTASGNWAFGGTGAGGWKFDFGYATSGNRDMFEIDPGAASDRTSTRTAGVVPPPGKATYLRFNHAFQTEPDYDGGVVEYSINGGAGWTDAEPLFTDNGYNRANAHGPLAGRNVFGDRSRGYESTRLDLSSLAGQNVLYRFRLASDATGGAQGWDIDDVRVYTCDPPGTAPAVTSAAGATFTVGAPGSFTVTATGSPAPTLSVAGALPAGVTFNAGTGALAGTPAAGTAATYNLTITAANGVLPSATQAFALTVAPAAGGQDFTPLAPARILDTRGGVGGHAAKLAPGETAGVVVTGVGGVPSSGVDSVVLNVTATGGDAATFLTVFPAGQSRPFASNLNVVAGQDVANLVVAKVGANGAVGLYNNQGTVDVIFDVVGWYRPAATCFTSLTPARILDTRSTTKVGPGQTSDVQVTGVGGVPSTEVGAVVVNVTATGATAATFLTVFPTGQARPDASNLNVVPGQDVPNLVVAKVGANGRISVYNNQGSTDVILDVVGWHPAGATCFTSLTPARIFDTRSTSKLGPAQSRDVQVTGVGGVPATGVAAVVLNVTATEATAQTFLTVFPAGQPRPLASNLNVVPNQDIPNLVVAKVGPNGSVTVYNNQGSTHAIFDVVGYYPG